jgi:hypothetical protein
VTAGGKGCVSNTARYARHFLQYAPGSDERDAEYEAINTANPGALPDSDKHSGYTPVIADKPAADAMEKGGQYQRLLLALVIFAGELGAFLLLGALAISVVMAQIVVLLLAAFSPVALVAATIPGRGHDLFRAWASHLVTYLTRKAAYSLILAVLLAVLSALEDATSAMGWLASFSLQAALLWMVFLSRHKLANQLTTTLGGHQPGREAQLRRLLGVAYATRTITPARRRSTPPRAQPTTPDEPPANDTSQAPVAPPDGHERRRQTLEPRVHPRESHRANHARPVPGLEPQPADGPNHDGTAVAAPHPDAHDRTLRQPHRHARAARADSTLPSPSAETPPARRPRRADTDSPSIGDADRRLPRTTDAGDGRPDSTRQHDANARLHVDDPPQPPQPGDGGAASLLDELRADRQRLDPSSPAGGDGGDGGEVDRPVPPPRRPPSEDGEPQS